MTIDALVDECWRDLPAIRKRVVGRDRVHQIVVDAISEWSPEYLAACQDNAQRNVYAADLTRRLGRRYEGQQEYGFVILTIILIAVISAVVQWLVKRWLDHHFTEADLQAWRQEMAS